MKRYSAGFLGATAGLSAAGAGIGYASHDIVGAIVGAIVTAVLTFLADRAIPRGGKG